MRKFFKGAYLSLLLAFLYAPIAVMILLSFNASKSRAKWGGFSFRWYQKLFERPDIMEALWLTLQVALIATAVATVLGTLAAIGIDAMRKRPASLMLNLSRLPMTTPDIVTGVSLMLMFVFVRMPMGYGTMLMAHIAFDVPYVLFSVLPKLKQLGVDMYEAALDLGCTPIQGVTRVIVPQIMPGVVTGALMAFTMSLDDFVISYFTAGSTAKNLSIVIYSAAKRGIEPSIYALSALMFVSVLALLLIVNKRSSLENVAG
ncbi:ABC transporter permease [Bacillota bacterium Meth-B3]|nr:ABC transporter permease [Christensenellaceae bacterium]MEA5069015.1 ABC transporter permease [Christensenellaceae bacterium]